MIIQIFGTKKCKETQKAVRFFKERKIKIQQIDLNQKGMSKGELRKVGSSVGVENMIDTDSTLFLNKGLKFASYDVIDTLFLYPTMMFTPVVREGNRATIGNKPDVWKKWLSS
ncbi:MAG: ArsC family transcriptional regulator [Candidatus Cloacimonetes bacterium 4572_65]|nr:MAG: ArsC family transcriptional regulator [Candidatus Cloacimonetes bacterium 4572_65]